MKKDKFDTAIDGINEDLIAESANIIPKRKRIHITRYASAAAACAVFAVGAALGINYASTSPELLKYKELNSGVVESQDTDISTYQAASESVNEEKDINNVSDFQSTTEKRNEKIVKNKQSDEDKAESCINDSDSAMNENDSNSGTVINDETTSGVEVPDSDINANNRPNNDNSDTNIPAETPSDAVNVDPIINTNGNDNNSTPDTSVSGNDICDILWSITVNDKTYIENRTYSGGFTPDQYLGTIAEFEVSGPYDMYNAANEVYTAAESETVLLIKLSNGKMVVLTLLF